jgi:hypothetical protein
MGPFSIRATAPCSLGARRVSSRRDPAPLKSEADVLSNVDSGHFDHRLWFRDSSGWRRRSGRTGRLWCADQMPRLACRHLLQDVSAYPLATPRRGRRYDHSSLGSSPKDYAFPVARIDLNGRHCVIFSEAEDNRHRMDKIDIASCYPADEGR